MRPARHGFAEADVPHTPVAGQALEIEIDDADGSRRVTLPAAVPGRRYAVGNGEGCDIVVNGKYVSRRHCEIWLDHGAWWVTDSGSTNGTRVESDHSVLGTSGTKAGQSGAGQTVIEVVPGARIVLSAVARGASSDYPRLLLGTARALRAPATPLAPSAPGPLTPVTPIAPRRRDGGLSLTVRMASGERSVDLPAGAPPFPIGRSRNQALTIDWAHDDVSGHHVDILDVDEAGARVIVHGDNGVSVGGVAHPAGARFRWNVGEKMILGTAPDRERECTLVLTRRA